MDHGHICIFPIYRIITSLYTLNIRILLKTTPANTVAGQNPTWTYNHFSNPPFPPPLLPQIWENYEILTNPKYVYSKIALTRARAGPGPGPAAGAGRNWHPARADNTYRPLRG